MIRSIFAVSPNDKHSYFIYYIPAHSFASDWIHEWMKEKFPEIAQQLGPKGVIIAPSPNHDQDFLEELLELYSMGAFFGDVHDQVAEDEPLPEPWKDPDHMEFFRQERMLHEDSPILIFSRSPLSKEGEPNMAYVINLEECRDERELGQVFDILITTIRNDNLDLLKQLSDLLNRHNQRGEDTAVEAVDAFELKPNIFGLGINFNYLLKKLAVMIIERKKGSR